MHLMSKPPVDLKNPATAGVLAWLVPGLGHWYQGRRSKAVLYAVCIIGLFVVGQSLGSWQSLYWSWVHPRVDPDRFRITFACDLGIGSTSLLALLQSILKRWGHDPILWGLFAEPTLQQINAIDRTGKLAEISRLYVIMAGLLNYLVIFDATHGPALAEDDAAADAAREAATVPAPAEMAAALTPSSVAEPAGKLA
jgi:hypothetical protein